jgi:selenocysteine-specific elongation factor
MHTRHFIVATAGHVDHGKSSLVKALTSIDPDRLPEEKARGITIDLGFAHLELQSTPSQTGGPSDPLSLGIVDVPGHEDFVKNMVAGVGSIDLALFIVAADDGWMPQTEEHLQILLYLGVTRAVIALTKADLATDEIAAIDAIHAKLRDTPFADAPIVPTSAITGRGIEDLKAALSHVLSAAPAPADIGKPRLPVDRVFTLRGFGTVVTGTLTGGVLRRGQSVILQPGGQATRLRTVQNHSREVESSPPGTRTALNLPDVANAMATGGEGVDRGHIVTLPGLGAAANTFDVWLHRSARLADSGLRGARPLKDGTRVRVHAGSASYPARVYLLGTKVLTSGQSALAQLRLEAPAFVFGGDRFILRDWPEQATLAGGIVLDPAANRRGFHSQARQRFLEPRAAQPPQPGKWILSQLERDGVARPGELLRQARFSDTEVQTALAELVQAGQAILVGEVAAAATWWRQLSDRAAAAIDAFHKAHPERPGLALTELRGALAKHVASTEIFNALVTHLCRSGFAQAGTTIRRASHRLSLPPHLQAAGTKVRATLAGRPVDPPSRKELAPDAPAQQALRFLVDTGEVIELSADILMSAEGYERAVGTIKDHFQKHRQATVSELRQAIGTSRRVLMPLLERLDKQGVTVRQGDVRVPGKR